MSIVFMVYEARLIGLESKQAQRDPRWLLQGRAYEDVKLGDSVTMGAAEGTVEEMRSYGRPLDVLSKMMTGELVVRWRDSDSPLSLSRSEPA